MHNGTMPGKPEPPTGDARLTEPELRFLEALVRGPCTEVAMWTSAARQTLATKLIAIRLGKEPE